MNQDEPKYISLLQGARIARAMVNEPVRQGKPKANGRNWTIVSHSASTSPSGKSKSVATCRFQPIALQ